jgi:hypothetical protein
MIDSKIVGFYKLVVPEILRNKISMLRNAGGLNSMRKDILSFYKDNQDDEIKEVIRFLRKKPLQLFPYQFPRKYDSLEIKVYHDDRKDLKYVFYEKKRMYFKRAWNENDIKKYYVNLLIEQDKKSPHRYLVDSFNIKPDDVVADIGAAEGIFSLSIISTIKKIYLFEMDGQWIEALEATFEPWKHKVEIINRFVSDKNDDSNITLDQFTMERNIRLDFIKIDVDGAEYSLLNGGRNLLKKASQMRIAICTYHKADDERLVRDFFNQYEYNVNPSYGYMIFYFDPHLSHPYLRRGLLRAEK